jgi:DNA-3-methyladenine glycosylase
MNELIKNTKLNYDFYCRNVLVVAKELLGKILVKNDHNYLYAGKIVEVEAYQGDIDEAAHSFAGETPRNKVMFNHGGYLYVYLSYGVHYCCNVVTGEQGKGNAVLIRAIEPLEGMDKMISNRFGKKRITNSDKYNLTNGPGKLCKALNINLSHSGLDLTKNIVYIINAPEIKKSDIATSKRIGITKSVDLPWRFFIKNNPYLSRK